MSTPPPVVEFRRAEPSKSRAVLFGGAAYRHHQPLPAVNNNLAELFDILTEQSLGGMAAQHVTVLPDPASAQDLHKKLAEQAREAEDVFFVYFSGHGRIGLRNELFLALPDTAAERDLLTYGALSYTALRGVFNSSPATSKILILDCCFSGLVVADMSAPSEVVEAQLDVSGTYILTATTGNAATADAPEGDKHTAFSGVLVEVLRQGVPPGPALLGLGAMFERVDALLTARGHPKPDQRNSKTVQRLALVANAAWNGERAEEGQGEGETGTAPTVTGGSAATHDQGGSRFDELVGVIEGRTDPDAHMRGLTRQYDRVGAAVKELQTMITSAETKHGPSSAQALELREFLIRFRMRYARTRPFDGKARETILAEALRETQDLLTILLSTKGPADPGTLRGRLLGTEVLLARCRTRESTFFMTKPKGHRGYLARATDQLNQVLALTHASHGERGLPDDVRVPLQLRARALRLDAETMQYFGRAYDKIEADLRRVADEQTALLGRHHPDTEGTYAIIKAIPYLRGGGMGSYQQRWYH
ncbi:caspase, EACC1-associated type [Streptomyces erythrochromogenes]|uniref:caspase, EACC1-associated type n=1 Tax=Streptomyces erythrochromogenes TaxID=285574 RepID=UPI0036B74C92